MIGHGLLHTNSVLLAAGNQSQSRISIGDIGAGGLSSCPFFPRLPPSCPSCQPKVSNSPRVLHKAAIIGLAVQVHSLCSSPQSCVCDIMSLADSNAICKVMVCSVLLLFLSAHERLGFEQYMLTLKNTCECVLTKALNSCRA